MPLDKLTAEVRRTRDRLQEAADGRWRARAAGGGVGECVTALSLRAHDQEHSSRNWISVFPAGLRPVEAGMSSRRGGRGRLTGWDPRASELAKHRRDERFRDMCMRLVGDARDCGTLRLAFACRLAPLEVWMPGNRIRVGPDDLSLVQSPGPRVLL